MRTLTAGQEAAVAGPVFEPQYLIEITLDQPYYWSTRQERQYNGNTYNVGGVQLGRVSGDSCELRLDNHDYAFTRGALDGDYLRQPVRVYWAYGAPTEPLYVERGYWEPGYTAEYDDTAPDVILLFDGIINETPEISEWLSISCTRTPPRLYPFRKLRPPIANFVPVEGYVVQFDGSVLRIEGERGR